MKSPTIKSLVLTLVLLVSSTGLLTGCPAKKKEVKYVSLMEARKAHTPQFTVKAKAPQPHTGVIPPGAQQVYYQSEKKDLKGWLFSHKFEGKRPAILYAHSGYALDKHDAKAIKPFLDAGYVVFLPSWRGENGNPGNFELCYGEVIDAVNALNWLGNRPEVESTEIYGAGNGVGATLIWLLAEVSPKLKKVAAYGPFPSMYRAEDTYVEPPFSPTLGSERKIRSPGEFIRDLKSPLLLIFSSGDTEDEKYLTQAEEILEENAGKIPEKVDITKIVGADHRDRMSPATTRMLNFFAQ